MEEKGLYWSSFSTLFAIFTEIETSSERVKLVQLLSAPEGSDLPEVNGIFNT